MGIRKSITTCIKAKIFLVCRKYPRKSSSLCDEMLFTLDSSDDDVNDAIRGCEDERKMIDCLFIST